MFCSTGVFQVLIVQYLDYHGIQGGDTGLGVLSSYLGLLLFAMPFMFDENDRRPRYHKMFIPTVVCDLLGQICAQVSIQMCGSGLFMVIYSSITVFAALFRWYVYGKSLSQGQWSGIFIISLGLMVTALGGKAEEGRWEKGGGLVGFSQKNMFVCWLWLTNKICLPVATDKQIVV